MSIDFSVNGKAMQAAWKDVTNEKSETNWAIFGYQGQTNVLTLVDTGEDGIEELRDVFNPNKIMYAFCKVEDPKTSLTKYVLFNWQGESAPGTRKGACAMHLPDVARFLAGSHLTISLRNEDEVEEDQILEKVSKTSSAFNFKEKPMGMEHSPEPVGTAHKRINPMQELPKMDDREKFWMRDQDEEKQRISEERQKKISEQRMDEGIRVKREEKERKERDEKIKDRERKVSQLRENEKKSVAGEDKAKWDDQVVEDRKDAEERRTRSEASKKERTNEAKQLIGQRQGNARAVFERNSSQGQMNFRRISGGSAPPTQPSARPALPAAPSSPLPQSKAPSSPLPHPKAPASHLSHSKATISSPPLDLVAPPTDFAPPPDAFNEGATPQPDLIGAVAPDIIASAIVPQPDVASEVNDDATYHARPATVTPEPPREATPPIQEATDATPPAKEATPPAKEATPPTNGDSPDSYGMCAVALYDYQAADETEISFDPGQIITHIDQIDPGWWQGLGPDGNYGLFPANYVDLIDNSELQIQ